MFQQTETLVLSPQFYVIYLFIFSRGKIKEGFSGKIGMGSCRQQRAGSECWKGTASCRREKLLPNEDNTPSVRRLQSPRSSSLLVLGSPTLVPKSRAERTLRAVSELGHREHQLTYPFVFTANRSASADSPRPFPLSQHSENSSV